MLVVRPPQVSPQHVQPSPVPCPPRDSCCPAPSHTSFARAAKAGCSTTRHSGSGGTPSTRSHMAPHDSPAPAAASEATAPPACKAAAAAGPFCAPALPPPPPASAALAAAAEGEVGCGLP